MTLLSHTFSLGKRYDAQGNLLPRSSRVPMGEGSPVAPTGNPTITSVSTTREANSLITVNGSGFGNNGPDIALFDDFEDVAENGTIPLNSPQIGSYESSGGNPWAFPLGRTGNRSFASGNDISKVTSNTSAGQLQKVFNEKHKNIHITYYVRLAPDTYFPGAGWDCRDRVPGNYSCDSSFKTAWIFNDADGFSAQSNKFDTVMTSWTSTNWAAGGNSWSWENSGKYLGWSAFSFSDWTRISQTIRDPLLYPDANQGTTHITTVDTSRTLPLLFNSKTGSCTYCTDKELKWDHFNIPGWIRSPVQDDVNPLYDDIYMAVGPYAECRVEIADNSDYFLARRVEITLAESWSDGQIVARIPRAVNHLTTGTWYAFVWRDGERISNAFQIGGT